MYRYRRHIVGLCHNLLGIDGSIVGNVVRYVPVSSKLQTEGFVLKKFHTDSLEADRSQSISKNLYEACVEQDRKKLVTSLKGALHNENFKPDGPFLLDRATEEFFSKFLLEGPLDDHGILTLRFLLRFGEKDSAFEKKVLSKLLHQDVMKNNALALASIRDCIEFANTTLRWTLAKRCEQVLVEGLSSNSFSKLVDSLQHHANSVLFPYLLTTCYVGIYCKQRATNIKSCVDLLRHLESAGITDHTLHKAVEYCVVNCNFKRFRFSIVDVRDLLMFHAGYHTIHVEYLQVLSHHLKLSLQVMTGKSQASVSHFLSDCLISYAIIGFRDKELITMIVDILKNSNGQIDDWNVLCAICALQHPCRDLFPVNSLQIFMDGSTRRKRYPLFLKTVIYEKLLTLEDAESLLNNILGEVNAALKVGTYLPHSLKLYFQLRAYIDLDLGAQRPFSDYEETLLEMFHQCIPKIEPSVRKKTVKFIVGQVLGDESLLRCFFWNKYGYDIDIEFFLDDEGNIQPENYEGNLTRFVILVLEEWDTIISLKDKNDQENLDHTPRIVFQILTRQLSKSADTEVILVPYPQWNLLKERNNRKEFIRSEINARMERRRKAKTS